MYPLLKHSAHVIRKQFNVSISAQPKIKMYSKYEDAVECINTLQSNLANRELAANRGIVSHSAIYSTSIAQTQKYLLRTGITLEQLDKLSVIHVAGTKGKGSTCAFCESILRQHGYKTGFFSSPHLVAVRERIKLNGVPLSGDIFAKYVLRIFYTLKHSREYDDDMPAYFRFLTILAFYIFLEKNIDVAVIEVGIGGEYDCTNILRNTPIAGITSLGIDHTSMLGNTLEQIAWQKAGIMKKNSKVFTVPQTDAAMKVLKERSIEKECTLDIVPNFSDYIWNNTPTLGINGDVQKINASLAIQLAHNWIRNCGQANESPTNQLEVPEPTKIGLEKCKWPGRNQIIQTATANFYLDGAHTVDSMQICAEWYKSVTGAHKRVLIFNATGDRNSEELLEILATLNFNYTYFVPNIATSNGSADQTSVLNTTEKQIDRCIDHKVIWLNLNGANSNSEVNHYFSVADALESLPKNEVTDILVTGSLHLVGAALSLLDPDLKTF